MSLPRYERPSLVRNVVGRMNKAGLRAGLGSAAAAVDEVPVEALCAEFGSPLYVFSERRLRARVQEARTALQRRHPEAALCCSYKTNYLGAICAIQHQEGSLAEVVSGIEYEQARRLSVPGDRIVFNGPMKTREELVRALQDRAIVHTDSFDEIFAIERIAVELGITPAVGLRVGLDAGVYPRWDRFGFDLQSGQAMQAARRIAKGGRLRLGGLHTHIGTYILDAAAYGRAAAQLSTFAGEIEHTLGARPTHLDLGGGWASCNTLASQYQAGGLAPSLDAYAEAIGSALTVDRRRQGAAAAAAGRAGPRRGRRRRHAAVQRGQPEASARRPRRHRRRRRRQPAADGVVVSAADRGAAEGLLPAAAAGLLFLLAGDYTNAADAYRAAAALEAAAVEPLLGLQQTLLAAERFDDAEKVGREVLQRDPKSYLGLSRQAWTLYKRGNCAAAADLYQKVLALYPGDADMLSGLGYAQLGLGKKAQAEANFKVVLVNVPGHVSATTGLTYCK